MITVLRPDDEQAASSLRLAPRPTALAGTTVGIISNGKAGTPAFFDHLEARLHRDWQVAEVVRRTKQNYSAPAERELIDEAARWAVMFAGVGD